MTVRPVTASFHSQPALEGAGVRLKRAFGFHQLHRFDPFLMLDDFRAARPEDYQAGFPWHPHRGMETITYVLAGRVEHQDSLGNRGTLADGDVQWMTAGSGIIHQEMPLGTPQGTLEGFQIWANLPARYKAMDPRYQDISRHRIPEVALPDGGLARVVAGRFAGSQGPVEDIITDPTFLDLALPPGLEFEHGVPPTHTAFAFILGGRLTAIGEQAGHGNGEVILFGPGDRISVKAGEAGARFLFLTGKPLGEPIAWHGPIVMNTHEEIEQALEDLDQGRFLKKGGMISGG